MKKSNFALFGVVSLAVVAAAGLLAKPVLNATSAECDHSGNHYTALANSASTAGTKEYWVCCQCHEHFLTEPSTGIWAEAGQAAAVEAGDDRYVAPRWASCSNTPATITDVTGGTQIDCSWGWGLRSYRTEKLVLDGLEFTMKCSNYANGADDVRGFYLHATASDKFYNEETSLVWSIWGRYSGQLRGKFAGDHDLNGTNVCYSDISKTNAGLSTEGGQLISNHSTNPSFGFKFVKVDDSWYKVTISYSGIWGALNYNVTEGVSVDTYFEASQAGVDADGKVAFSVFGMGTSESMQFIGL